MTALTLQEAKKRYPKIKDSKSFNWGGNEVHLGEMLVKIAESNNHPKYTAVRTNEFNSKMPDLGIMDMSTNQLVYYVEVEFAANTSKETFAENGKFLYGELNIPNEKAIQFEREVECIFMRVSKNGEWCLLAKGNEYKKHWKNKEMMASMNGVRTNRQFLTSSIAKLKQEGAFVDRVKKCDWFNSLLNMCFGKKESLF